jgi:NADPH-dependent 2,4-dienoyl-CoA reductase/sulfur reductase-like enzyme
MKRLNNMTHHVILGAGPAGVIAAETIRKHSASDRITLIGDEREPPIRVWPSPIC